MILAYNIVSEPEIVDRIKHKYQIIFDKTTEVSGFEYMNEAICVMANKGWRCVSITSTRSSGGSGFASEHYIFALMERREECES